MHITYPRAPSAAAAVCHARRLGAVVGALLLLCAGTAGAAEPRAAVPPAAPVASPAAPSVLPRPVVAIVDMEDVLKHSIAAQGVEAQLEERRLAYKKEITVYEDKLRATDQQLNDTQTTLTKEEFEDKKRTFTMEVAAVQRFAQSHKAALDHAFTTASDTLVARFHDTVTMVAHRRGATLVLNREQVLMADEALDISAEVLARLNESMTRLDVTVAPETSAEDAPILEAIRNR